MRDFYLFTSKKLTAKDCFEALSKEIKNVEMNSPSSVWIKGKWNSVLWFSDQTMDDFIFETPEELEAFKKKIPIDNPCVTDFETHRSFDAKRVITVLMKIYPDLYINVDDETDWLGSAQEYLDKKFDY